MTTLNFFKQVMQRWGLPITDERPSRHAVSSSQKIVRQSEGDFRYTFTVSATVDLKAAYTGDPEPTSSGANLFVQESLTPESSKSTARRWQSFSICGSSTSFYFANLESAYWSAKQAEWLLQDFSDLVGLQLFPHCRKLGQIEFLFKVHRLIACLMQENSGLTCEFSHATCNGHRLQGLAHEDTPVEGNIYVIYLAVFKDSRFLDTISVKVNLAKPVSIPQLSEIVPVDLLFSSGIAGDSTDPQTTVPQAAISWVTRLLGRVQEYCLRYQAQLISTQIKAELGKQYQIEENFPPVADEYSANLYAPGDAENTPSIKVFANLANPSSCTNPVLRANAEIFIRKSTPQEEDYWSVELLDVPLTQLTDLTITAVLTEYSH